MYQIKDEKKQYLGILNYYYLLSLFNDDGIMLCMLQCSMDRANNSQIIVFHGRSGKKIETIRFSVKLNDARRSSDVNMILQFRK